MRLIGLIVQMRPIGLIRLIRLIRLMSLIRPIFKKKKFSFNNTELINLV